ncbi:alpha-amylase family glycosyl hydrolase [Streptomyces sp. NPDC127097]|uniref:alpha-amylase family glycosyl hydrolase n=1 Tax=Streptomyces sp. NPDC127097 TaxID=3347136 RepID=UPI0036672013
MHLPLNFGLLRSPWQARATADLVRDVLRALPDEAVPTWVMGSHDDPRVASRVGRAQAPNAMMLLITLNLTDHPVPVDQLLAGRYGGRSLSTLATKATRGARPVLAPHEGVIWTPK